MSDDFSKYKANELRKIEHIIHASLALAGGALWKADKGSVAAAVLITAIIGSTIGYAYWYLADWAGHRHTQTQDEQSRKFAKHDQAVCFISVLLSYALSISSLLLMFLAGNPQLPYCAIVLILAGVAVAIVGIVIVLLLELRRHQKI